MSIQSQINAATVSSTVTIAPGTYNENVTISKALTLIGGPGVFLKGTATGWNGISVNASNVTIKGFDISGARGDGIEANGRHHITLRDIVVHGCGESGIQFNQCDWWDVQDCAAYGNAGTGWFSGFSAYQNKVLATGTLIDGKYRNVLRNFRGYDQDTVGGNHTDGNGVIIDDFNNTQGGGQTGGYTHGALVENVLAYGNDGKGVQVTWSNNTIVRRVTAYGNDKDPQNTGTWRGGISISESTGCTVEDCISVAVRGAGILAQNRAYCDTSQAIKNATKWTNCIGWDAAGTPSIRLDGGNPLPAGIQWVDPKLVNYVPTITTTAGWRPAGTIQPIEEPDPDMAELIARVETLEAAVSGLQTVTAGMMANAAADKAALAALDARVSGIEMLPIDPELGVRVAALEAFDKSVKDLG